MSKPKQIGITGGIGSGKTLVSRIFSLLGVPVYDSDLRARDLMNTDPHLVGEIRSAFGPESYSKDHTLNRMYLASVVFPDRKKLDILNALVHPRVHADFLSWADAQHDATYVLREAALIFESGSHKLLDGVIVVSAPERLRIARVLQRDPQRSEGDVLDIMSNQLSEEDRLQMATYVIYNDESRLVIPQVIELHDMLRNR